VQLGFVTPESASVSVMLHVTVCDAEVVLIADGVKLNPVSAGAVVSQSARTTDPPSPPDNKSATNAVRTPLQGFIGLVLRSG
jgi:hypothetical protein